MRPEDVGGKPFFRREAENYRLLRHLGEINLFRPMPVRLITLFPITIVGAFAFALLQLQVRKQFETRAAAVQQGNDRLQMILPAEASRYFERGDVIDISNDDTKATVHASVISAAPAECGAGVLPSADASSSCLVLQVHLHSNLMAPTTASLLSGTNQVKSAPRSYIHAGSDG